MHCFWGHKEGETLSLHPDELVHAVKVLRIAPSDIIHVFDGNGDTYIGRVTHVHKKYVHALCVETRKATVL
jgi:16S rRNA U1498 N3-methylase RsmE